MSTENNLGEPGNTHPPQNKNYGLETEDWKVLDFLFDNPRPMVLRQIAAAVELPESHAHHHIDRLLAFRAAETTMSWQIAGPLGFDPVGYVLTPIGRAIVLARRKAGDAA